MSATGDTACTWRYERALRADRRGAFDAVLGADLTEVFDGWQGLIPPVREVRDEPERWDTPGQRRTIVTADRGTLCEELLEVDRPRRFRYRIDELTGPLRPVISEIHGTWEFVPQAGGVHVVWTWEVQPTNRAASLSLALVGRLWQGYARRALDRIEARLAS